MSTTELSRLATESASSSAGARPKICILTQYFPPEMGAPQARLSELGERLIDLGWDVEALTALPNYPTGKVFEEFDPRQPHVHQVGRIRTVRVPLYTAKQGFSKRIRCYFSFVRGAKRFGPKLCQRPDLLFVESPPLFISYAAKYLAKRWKCPFVFNVSDLWPESAIRMGVVKPGLATKMAERLELATYRRATAITGQSDEIIASVRERCPEVRTQVITNGVDPSRFGPEHADDEARQLIGSEPGPIFIFAGLIGLAQGLNQILDLAKSLDASTPGRFVLVGDGPAREDLEKRIERESIDRVKIVPAQPRERIPALLASADVAIISLGMAIPGAVPSKIYEAMASSLPILLIADGEPAKRIKNAKCGIAVSPSDIQNLLPTFKQLACDAELRREYGEQGRAAAETTYNRDHIAAMLDRVLRDVLPASRDI
ncbi:glycosyltransferase family 4 protein [Novipirellula rosea]|uniref:Glycosyltransferase family 4 protein n=1 Tax=Novipirellula rosea TaxID=1031540 RepID=A0ABP8MNQ8_9BACT